MTPLAKKSNQKDKSISFLEILQYIVLTSLILYFGKILFIPLSFSLLISFILYPICKWMEKKGISHIIAICISLFSVFFFVISILYILFLQLSAFSKEWISFKSKLWEAFNQLSLFMTDSFQISLEEQLLFFKNIVNNSGNQTFSIVQNILYSSSEFLFFIIIIPIFSGLILYHRQLLTNALYHLFPSNKKELIYEILTETINAYYNFIKGMALVYLIVGILNSIGLAIVGVPHPIVFGFIASLLTFIPYVGILISSLVPIAITWITYNSIWYPIGVILVFVIVQILEAYIIFPFAVGRRLKINTLIIIIMITVGGIIWGAAGMILFIPFISIIKLIADRTVQLKTLAILLGEGKYEKELK
ncbi:AI-2E family transporter [Flavobacterium sp. NG2]|uniref:AI-2E family transporter n=1 Tax=Flavobacterium sp. NG2 TaxID=3097547 RepID=UPI002A830A02|nr:AI-2E family transporter [Flavobacterium sp. NG2]WPR70513.1 AI-2E family transporter [Flavobacterium sp. NG2]